MAPRALTGRRGARVLALETRTEVRRVWASVYDRLLALRAIEEAHAGLRRGAGSFRDSRLLVIRRAREQGESSGDFETLLARSRADGLRRAVVSGHPPARGIEAIAAGVSFTPLERAAHADSIAVLRPALDRAD